MTSNPPPPKAGQAQTHTPTPKTDYAEARIWDRIASAKDITDSDNFKAGLDESFHHARTLESAHSSLLASHERLKQALEPVAKFIEAFDRKPIKMHDEFYGIHTGTEFEASLKLSELRAIATALSLAHSVNNGAGK